MKRFVTIFLVFLSLGAFIQFSNTNLKPIYADSTSYGLIGENTFLLDEEYTPITSLPATYFVQIVSEDEDFYFVNYNDLSGYVDKKRIFKTDYEPRLKFASGFFVAQNDTHPVLVRKNPQSNSQIICQIPSGEKAYYYGSVPGEALILAAGNTWYYVKYTDTQTKFGYVYAPQGIADSFSVNPGDKMQNQPIDLTTNPKDDSFPDWVFILVLCVPVVVIILILFGRGKKESGKNEQ